MIPSKHYLPWKFTGSTSKVFHYSRSFVLNRPLWIVWGFMITFKTEFWFLSSSIFLIIFYYYFLYTYLLGRPTNMSTLEDYSLSFTVNDTQRWNKVFLIHVLYIQLRRNFKPVFCFKRQAIKSWGSYQTSKEPPLHSISMACLKFNKKPTELPSMIYCMGFCDLTMIKLYNNAVT
jgi:hypothetical protein